MFGNSQLLSWVLWSLALLLGLGVLVAMNKLFMQADPMQTPAYVPLDDELPEISLPETWKNFKIPRPNANVPIRHVDSPQFLPLHKQAWNQIPPAVAPGVRPPPPGPIQKQDPTLAEAMAQLRQELAIQMLMPPSQAWVSVKSRPNELITVISEKLATTRAVMFALETLPGATPELQAQLGREIAAAYLAHREDQVRAQAIARALAKFLPERSPEYLAKVGPAVGRAIEGSLRLSTLVCDLSRFNCPCKVLEIQPDGLYVTYKYREKDFEFVYARDPDAKGPPKDWRITVFGNSATSSSPTAGTGEPMSMQPSENVGRVGTPAPAQPRPGQPGQPALAPNDVPESYQENDDVWVIAGKEIDDARGNLDNMIAELKPRQSYNRDKQEYEGVSIGEVPQGSLAQKRGFVAGDTVISINNVPVNNVNDIRNYVRNNKDLPEYVVVFDRRGERKTKTYKVPRNNK